MPATKVDKEAWGDEHTVSLAARSGHIYLHYSVLISDRPRPLYGPHSP